MWESNNSYRLFDIVTESEPELEPEVNADKQCMPGGVFVQY